MFYGRHIYVCDIPTQGHSYIQNSRNYADILPVMPVDFTNTYGQTWLDSTNKTISLSVLSLMCKTKFKYR